MPLQVIINLTLSAPSKEITKRRPSCSMSLYLVVFCNSWSLMKVDQSIVKGTKTKIAATHLRIINHRVWQCTTYGIQSCFMPLGWAPRKQLKLQLSKASIPSAFSDMYPDGMHFRSDTNFFFSFFFVGLFFFEWFEKKGFPPMFDMVGTSKLNPKPKFRRNKKLV